MDKKIDILTYQKLHLTKDIEITDIIKDIRMMEWSFLYARIYKQPTGFYSIEQLNNHIKEASLSIKKRIKSYGVKNFFKKYKTLKEKEVFEGIHFEGNSLVCKWLVNNKINWINHINLIKR